MKRKLILIFLVIGIAATVAFFLPQQTPVYPDAMFENQISIAPLQQALTFARSKDGGGVKLLAVIGYRDNVLSALDLTELFGHRFDDPVDLFNELGYEAIQRRIESEPPAALIKVDVDSLILPLRLADSHVAAGTNFAAHADESSVEDGPFLFTKLVTPTPSNTTVSADEALLDYEVELAFVTLSQTPLSEVPRYMGLILANDFTDRATLLRHLNPDDVISGDGFTTGKSREGFLPVGNMLVIPSDLRSFANAIELKLAVNGKLRQRSSMELAIWDIDELFKQIQARQATRWMHLDQQIGLPIQNGMLPARTLILAGTPDGTVFSGITKRTMAAGLLNWMLGGWGIPLKQQVIQQYIKAASAQGQYLHSGDEVVIQVDRLGVVRSRIQ